MKKNIEDVPGSEPEFEEGSPAWNRAVLAILEKRGKLVRIGKLKRGSDGVLSPVYVEVNDNRKLEDAHLLAEFEHTLNSLERKGLIRKTGQYRMGDDGFLYPCYVSVDYPGPH